MKKIHDETRDVLLGKEGNSVFTDGSERIVVGDSRKEFTEGEKRPEREIKLFRTGSPVEFRKVRWQVVGLTDANSLPEEQLGKLKKEKNLNQHRSKDRIDSIKIRFRRERGGHVFCHALLTDGGLTF